MKHGVLMSLLIALVHIINITFSVDLMLKIVLLSVLPDSVAKTTTCN